MTFERIKRENKMINNLIENGRNDFDIFISIELQALAERIQDKRSISTRAARKILTELLEHEVANYD